jgi:hypothetical protein
MPKMFARLDQNLQKLELMHAENLGLWYQINAGDDNWTTRFIVFARD